MTALPERDNMTALPERVALFYLNNVLTRVFGLLLWALLWNQYYQSSYYARSVAQTLPVTRKSLLRLLYLKLAASIRLALWRPLTKWSRIAQSSAAWLRRKSVINACNSHVGITLTSGPRCLPRRNAIRDMLRRLTLHYLHQLITPAALITIMPIIAGHIGQSTWHWLSLLAAISFTNKQTHINSHKLT